MMNKTASQKLIVKVAKSLGEPGYSVGDKHIFENPKGVKVESFNFIEPFKYSDFDVDSGRDNDELIGYTEYGDNIVRTAPTDGSKPKYMVEFSDDGYPIHTADSLKNLIKAVADKIGGKHYTDTTRRLGKKATPDSTGTVETPWGQDRDN